jgi:hypothetical protein
MEVSQFADLPVLMEETVVPLAQHEGLFIQGLQKLVTT